MAEKKGVELLPAKKYKRNQPLRNCFDMRNFPHWLDTDEEDYDDYDEKDKQENLSISSQMSRWRRFSNK